MRIGTKSLLFGAHQFILHPLLLAIAWWRLFGFPLDPRLWVAFIVHDLGYWGKPNMDGPEGTRHPEFGACFMGRFFGKRWHDFCLYHSRYYARAAGVKPSRLCIADKYLVTLEPWWFYLPRVRWSGELEEYLALAKPPSNTEEQGGKYVSMNIYSDDSILWYLAMQQYMYRWVIEHKNGKQDTWTPER